MIYLSPTTKIPDSENYGVMFSAKHTIGGLSDALESGVMWMIDNNAFTDDFTFYVWIKALIKYREYAGTCLGVPIPDVVGDALATLRLFSRYWACVKDLGYPVAFVSQNGITPEVTPWEWLDVLFIGGDDGHKLGPEAAIMIAEAKARNKWVHIGRVNSEQRITGFWMADSCDGSGLIRDSGDGRDRRFKQYTRGIEYARNKKKAW